MRSSATSMLDRQAASREETPTCHNHVVREEKPEVQQVPALAFRMVPPTAPALEHPEREPNKTFSNRWTLILDNRDAQPKIDENSLFRPAHSRTGYPACRF